MYFLIHYFFFFFNDTATTEIYTLSLHDALPISCLCHMRCLPSHVLQSASVVLPPRRELPKQTRSEEHTSELQSRQYLVCRLLLEKKKKKTNKSQQKEQIKSNYSLTKIQNRLTSL